MKQLVWLLLIFCFPISTFAEDKMVNVYVWSNIIPDTIIHQFEKETGIKVNLSTYENNEIMYAKIRATPQAGYDVIMPSGYFVDRMHHQLLLEKLDKTKLSNWKNIAPDFQHPAYDPQTEVSIPYIWGITGIFLNSQFHQEVNIKKWGDLWNKKYHNQLMLLDDAREVFSMALLSLGYSANDSDPTHIEAAYHQLQTLMPNVKVFSSDTVVSIIVDEDATLGMSWNGDAYKATRENPAVKFIFPSEGFVIWVDNFAMPHNAPHKEAAYKFLNYLLRPDVAEAIALYTHFPITNLTAQQHLPQEVRNNPIIYPPKTILKRGHFQTDLSDEVIALYEKYWEALKMGA